MDTTIFKKNYTLTTNYSDFNDHLLMTTIVDLFQDAAGKHAKLISEDNDSFKEKGYYWVITRSRVEFLKPVFIKPEISIKTYQSQIGAASYEREYFLYDLDEEVLVKGDSRWCVIDSNTNRIVPTKLIKNTNEVCSDKAFDTQFIKIPSIDEFDYEFDYEIVYMDIDHNNHMNNTKYINPLINYFKKNIKRIEINYLKQSYLGDKITYRLKKDSNNCYFAYIYKNDDLINKCFIELFD